MILAMTYTLSDCSRQVCSIFNVSLSVVFNSFALSFIVAPGSCLKTFLYLIYIILFVYFIITTDLYIFYT